MYKNYDLETELHEGVGKKYLTKIKSKQGSPSNYGTYFCSYSIEANFMDRCSSSRVSSWGENCQSLVSNISEHAWLVSQPVGNADRLFFSERKRKPDEYCVSLRTTDPSLSCITLRQGCQPPERECWYFGNRFLRPLWFPEPRWLCVRVCGVALDLIPVGNTVT